VKDSDSRYIRLTSDLYKQNEKELTNAASFFILVEHVARTTRLTARLIPLFFYDEKTEKDKKICAIIETFNAEGKCKN